MISYKVIALTAVVLLATSASAQEIKDNLFPKAGDICKDRGDPWKNITLGPCAAGTVCQTVKRGVYKCVYTDARGKLPLGTVCYNETRTDQKDRSQGEKWRTYYRVRNCVFGGVDKQGTPSVQCVQTQDPKIYTCQKVPLLGSDKVFTVAGSMIWGRWNDNQAYDACNGCPCTMPGRKCKTGPCKYPACGMGPCNDARKNTRCATA